MAKKTPPPAPKKAVSNSIVNKMLAGKGISNGVKPGKTKGC